MYSLNNLSEMSFWLLRILGWRGFVWIAIEGNGIKAFASISRIFVGLNRMFGVAGCVWLLRNGFLLNFLVGIELFEVFLRGQDIYFSLLQFFGGRGDFVFGSRKNSRGSLLWSRGLYLGF